MQEANTSTADFNYDKGRDHGHQALVRLRQLGFKAGTTVFFAVDFDAIDDQITMYVIPYFQGVKDVLNSTRVTYKTGVYGTRNVCTRVITAGLASEAFASDMSWGYSGNLGYTLPPSWSYDQIAGETLGNITGTSLAIDKNVQSARANPAHRGDVLPTPVLYNGPDSATPSSFDEDYFWYLTEMTVEAEAVESSLTGSIASDLVLHYLQRPTYWPGGPGELARLFPAYEPLPENKVGVSPEVAQYIGYARHAFEGRARRPAGDLEDRIQHWAASCRGYQAYSDTIPPQGATTTVGDLGAWALDLAQAWKEFAGLATPSPAGLRQWMSTYIGHETVNVGFGRIDLIGDIDAFLVDYMLRADRSRPLSDCVREIEASCSLDHTWRYRRFIDFRFGGDAGVIALAGADVFNSGELWKKFSKSAVLRSAPSPTPSQGRDIGNGFADAISRLAGR